MPDTLLPGPTSPPSWIGDLTRVPFWVYHDGSLPKVEQERIFEGPVWNYLCLEDEIANPGDWRTTAVGRVPVVVARHGRRRPSRTSLLHRPKENVRRIWTACLNSGAP